VFLNSARIGRKGRLARAIAGMYRILVTRDVYGYNSVWERILRYLAGVARSRPNGRTKNHMPARG